MITTKKELKSILNYEKQLYLKDFLNRYQFADRMLNESKILIWKFIKEYRTASYYFFNRKKNVFYLFNYIIHHYKKQKLSLKLGFSIDYCDIGEGFEIYHYGNIVINGSAKIGKNVKFHGNNCVGNKGEHDLSCPTIGDNVDIGFGAVIIGGIFIANNVKIGAVAVVCKSCLIDGAILTGVPADIKEIKNVK